MRTAGPSTVARIRTELAPVPDRPEARIGLLIVCAQILQAQDRIDFYAELASPVCEHLAHMQAPPPRVSASSRLATDNGEFQKGSARAPRSGTLRRLTPLHREDPE
ncbi:hypothetical protein [Streptomyces globosus]|uniref:hypothetical protein n=1 Tax=Streptomyces globosus TaxID=68209 RepID=UPI0031E11927